MGTKRSIKENAVRFLCVLLGLYILAQGIAFTILGALGTDSITSPALVASIYAGSNGCDFLTVDIALICVHITLVLIQIALLRSKYEPIQLFQVALGILLGFMLRGCLLYTNAGYLPADNYALSLIYTFIGCVISAFGIFTFVKAEMIPLSAEGLCLALSRAFNWRFSRVKVGVDCSMIAIAVIASLLLFGTVEGVREGTLICACSTGFIIGFFFKVKALNNFWDKLFARVGGRQVELNKQELA